MSLDVVRFVFEADEDVEIDNFVHQDVQRIPVKTLRKVIPKLRIAVYCSDSLTSGKRKCKRRSLQWVFIASSVLAVKNHLYPTFNLIKPYNAAFL